MHNKSALKNIEKIFEGGHCRALPARTTGEEPKKNFPSNGRCKRNIEGREMNGDIQNGSPVASTHQSILEPKTADAAVTRP